MDKYNLEKGYNKKTFRFRFEKALDIAYKDVKPCHRNGKFIIEYQKKYADDKTNIENQIKAWKNNKKTLPCVEQLLKICNVLDCDIEFFISDKESFNKDIIDTSSTTGLSTEAIINLRKMNKESLLILDILLENGKLESILQSISDMNKINGKLEMKDVSTERDKMIEISDDMKNYAFINSVINDCKSVIKSKKYNDHMKDIYLKHHDKITVQLPVEIEKQLMNDVKKEKVTFNEIIDNDK